MGSEAVERAAKAVQEKLDELVRRGDLIITPVADFSCAAIARAVMASLREPTDAMIHKMQEWSVCAGDIEKGWAAAIDEALRDG